MRNRKVLAEHVYLVKGESTGRLLKYSPKRKTTSFVTGGFFYANGVALGPDEAFVLVSETCKLRVIRHWLKGPKVISLGNASWAMQMHISICLSMGLYWLSKNCPQDQAFPCKQGALLSRVLFG